MEDHGYDVYPIILSQFPSFKFVEEIAVYAEGRYELTGNVTMVSDFIFMGKVDVA